MKKIYLEWLDICECLERICAKVEGADFDEMYSMFADVEPADVRPVVRGEWIPQDKIFEGIPFECSICGEETRETVMGKPRFNYCPMCGATMEYNNA